ncbi:MAG: hypothetical protein D6730_17725 [Bacteroidetes bacterium]|nr:MAG: hypothetical protein D6730_17725 [Bacteroidota bacterium]
MFCNFCSHTQVHLNMNERLSAFKWLLVSIICLLYASGPAVAQQPSSPLLASFEAYRQAKSQTRFGVSWIPLGPTLNSARVEAVQADPLQPGTLYVAFGSGNLWKSTNHGMSWKPIFENMPALGIGDIALAPSDANVLYVGTGESLKKARNFTMPGTGIYRSTDAGASWEHLGLEDIWHTGEIAVHPTNPQHLLVAALGHFWTPNPHRGLYCSTDGGKNWEQVLYLDEHTGANDVVFAPSDPQIAYAAMWENYPGISGKNSGVYRSEDGGRSWQKASKGLPTGAGLGRIGLAVSHQNPLKVYALVDNLEKKREHAAEVYRSLDGGRSWSRTHEQELLIFPGIGWYFADMYVNPQNDEEIFGLGVRMAHSTDGGKTFQLVGGQVFHFFPSAAQTLHLDHCELWINPLNPRHLILGNDGGLYISYDKGQHWMHYNNLPTGEFYDICLDDQQPYHIYGGTQDDATVYGPAKAWNPAFPDGWKYLWIDAWSGGDGCVTQVEPGNPNTVYFSMQHGAIRRKDMAADTSVSIRPSLPAGHRGKLEFNFVTPYFISPHQHQTLYHAGNYVFKSTDRGNNWQLISPDLSVSAHPQRRGTAAGALAESPLQPGLLYMGTDKGAFWVSKNGGGLWEEHSQGLPTHYIRSIAPSRYQVSRVYVALSGINYDDLGAYLYVSEEYGQAWKPLMQGLPNEVVNVVVEDPLYEDILYAGMYRGVYISTDRGASWQLLGSDLPAASVADLEIQPEELDLVAATHGRGIFKLNLKPIHQAYLLTKTQTEAGVHLFPPPSAQAPYYNDTHGDVARQSIEPFLISFWLPQTMPYRLRLMQQDSLVWETDQQQGQQGLNQYVWDLMVEQVNSARPYFIHNRRYLRPGTYQLLLETDQSVSSTDWAITKRMER